MVMQPWSCATEDAATCIKGGGFLSSNPYNKKEVGESFVKTHTQKKNGVFVQQIPAG